jgi:hypothetical protein
MVIRFYSLERNDGDMRRFMPVLSGAVMAIALFACSGAASSSQEDPPPNADPHKGWVLLWEAGSGMGAIKFRCHDTVLLYETVDDRGGITTSPLVPHPLCK